MIKDAGGDRTPRTNLMLSALVFRDDASEPSLHRVSNLSATGARVAQPGPLAPGERIGIAIGQARMVQAQVVRIDDRGAGVRFEEEIDLEAARLRRTTDFVPQIASGWMAERQRTFR